MGCRSAVFGNPPVRIAATILLSTIIPKAIRPADEPATAANNGRTLVINNKKIANKVPGIEPKAFHKDF